MGDKLSVIIPTCLEWPQVLLTVRNIAEELRDRADFEIIVIDNYCDEVKVQAGGKEDDGTRDHLIACAKGHPWLKVLHYTDKLSHWQAKNMGVAHSTGNVLWFCDAHCIVSRDALFHMLNSFRCHERFMKGNATLHLPLTYHIMEYHKLVYKLRVDLPTSLLDYRFTTYNPPDHNAAIFYEVPAMSTCGVMMSKSLYDKVGGWPTELGIYGGGENFLNYVMSIMGMKKYIKVGHPLCHHGSKRQYHWNYTDHKRNQAIAAYMVGGEAFAMNFMAHCKGDVGHLQSITHQMIPKQKKHREHIKSQIVMSMEDWLKGWTK